MFKKGIIAIALLGAAATVTHAAADTAQKDPKTGKNCVTFFSSEPGDSGLIKLNFRNTCATAFEIRIPAGSNIRKKSIDAGTPENPSKAFVTCKSSDGCETAKWLFE